jgi:hypothetical protein
VVLVQTFINLLYAAKLHRSRLSSTAMVQPFLVEFVLQINHASFQVLIRLALVGKLGTEGIYKFP